MACADAQNRDIKFEIGSTVSEFPSESNPRSPSRENDAIHLTQLNLPNGVELAHLVRGGEDLSVVAIQKARGSVDEDDGAGSDGGDEESATGDASEADKGDASES